jgi:hypothetical protein
MSELRATEQLGLDVPEIGNTPRKPEKIKFGSEERKKL